MKRKPRPRPNARPNSSAGKDPNLAAAIAYTATRKAKR